MKLKNPNTQILTFLLTAAWSMTAGAAMVITESANAPTSSIISQPLYGGTTSSGDGTENYYAPGQTFTTGAAFSIGSITVKGAGSSGGFTSASPWVLTISQVVGGKLIILDQETATFKPSVGNDTNYLTFTPATTVALSASTQYAFNISTSNNGSGGDWFALAKGTNSTDALPGGDAMQFGSGWAQVTGSPITGSQAWGPYDHTFFITATDVPEPSVYAMALSGVGMLLGLQGWRRRA